MNDLVLSVRLTADGKGLVEVVGEGADSFNKFDKSVDRSSTTARKAAKSNDQLGKSAGKLNGMYKKLAGTLLTVGAGYLGLQKGRELIKAFEAQEQSAAALDQSILSMGRTTEGLSKQLQDLASQIQADGIIGDEAIIKGQSFLTTYGAITDKLLPRTTRLMADLAAKMGGDTVSAANLLGKASMGMTGELSRIGITLSETAKSTKDFELILSEIEQQAGGMNAALSQTATGGIKQYENAWGDVEEQLGQILAIAISPYLRDMSDDLAISEERVQALGEMLHDGIAIGTGAVAGLSTAIAVKMVVSMAAWTTATIRQAHATAGLTSALGAQTRQVTAATAAQALYTAGASRMMGVVRLLGGPAGFVLTAASAIGVWALASREAANDTSFLNDETEKLAGTMDKAAQSKVVNQIAAVTEEINRRRVAIEGYRKGLAGAGVEAGGERQSALLNKLVKQEQENIKGLNDQLVMLQRTRREEIQHQIIMSEKAETYGQRMFELARLAYPEATQSAEEYGEAQAAVARKWLASQESAEAYGARMAKLARELYPEATETAEAYGNRMFDLARLAYPEATESAEEYGHRMAAVAQQQLAFIEASKQNALEWSDAWTSAGNRFAAGIGDSTASAILEQKNFGDAMNAVARGAVHSVISGLVEIGVKKVAMSLLSKTLMAQETAASSAAAAATAAAWGPAAAATSVASFGSAAAIGGAALLAAFAISKTLFGGSESGGGSTAAPPASAANQPSYVPSLSANQNFRPMQQVTNYYIYGNVVEHESMARDMRAANQQLEERDLL